MSENLADNVDTVAHVEGPTAQVSGGALLRRAREAAGLQIATLAAALKVPEKKLEDLEADRFDLLPDTVFVRALAASVCRSLKIDAAPILEKLPFSTTPSLKTDESSINTPFRPAGQGAALASLQHMSKPFAITVLALLLGAVVLVFLPQEFSFKTTELEKIEAVTGASGMPSQVAEVVVAAAQPVLPVLAASQVQPSSEPVLTSSPVPVVVPPPAPALVQASEPVSGTTSGTLVFKSRETSWVEVVDASGTTQVRRNLLAGETVTVSGTLPLAVTVGRASSVDVQVRGQPFDLSRLAKDNVARFEVK
jgi:cytoskeleton protein RodZ